MTLLMAIRGLQHIAVEVADIDRSLEFYCSYLGLKVTERQYAGEVEAIPFDTVFLRAGTMHHDFVLVHDPAKTYRARTAEEMVDGPPLVHHFAFECVGLSAWQAMMEMAKERGYEIVHGPVLYSPQRARGEGAWGENKSFYLADPDGHLVELFCNMASIAANGDFVSHRGKRIKGAVAEEI